MICALLRAVQCAEKLRRSSGKRLFLPHLVLNKAGLKTAPGLSWGLRDPKKTVRREGVPGVTRRTIWTQGQSPPRAEEDGSKQVSVHSKTGETVLSASQKVKEAGRDFSYLVVVLLGIGITGGLFYTIFRELFSSSSPSKIYGKALEKCRSHPEVISVFGEPVKGYGEMTRRGRRQHVSFIEYAKDGLKHMRVKFYIQGSEPGKQGTVHLEVKENPESGEYEFRYIFVELEPFPGRTIVIEDNRS
ncbi:mitochondrial import inner membrane translocase subunit Tim21 [Hyaena hyaena]|uniref:mitochondrial import inner membrane translocase subunit Tim21 n=1 Tax=Hyaena hyaena TaxID=95912 RepID=UPI0019250DEF|nr:mitochondrial import inner membrane translocase subunit Tim21 [Hyaena hyaena]XP_039092343.1 mitochondrial import inner membrane translocase subunit Tim21 [Hyaena hyaena]